jgi:hypothetical protein
MFHRSERKFSPSLKNIFPMPNRRQYCICCPALSRTIDTLDWPYSRVMTTTNTGEDPLKPEPLYNVYGIAN